MNIGCRTEVNLSKLGMDSKQELERLCKGKQKIAKYPEKKRNQESALNFRLQHRNVASWEVWVNHGSNLRQSSQPPCQSYLLFS